MKNIVTNEVNFGSGPTQLTGPVVDGVVIRQSFVAVDSLLDTVLVMFSTYMRTNPGSIKMKVVEASSNHVVGIAVVAARDLKDNRYKAFRLNIPLLVGKKYEIRLETQHCRSGQSATAHHGRAMNDGHFFIGSKLYPKRELLCKFLYSASRDSVEIVSVYDEPFGKAITGMVSVIITHMDRPAMLQKCLESVAAQTYGALEIIVVDDGSTKECREDARRVVSQFQSSFRAKFVSHGTNMGANAARNTGYYQSSGDYVYFLDCDCFLDRDAFAVMLNALSANPKAAYAYCGYRIGDKEKLLRDFKPALLLDGNYISTMSMVRRNAFLGFDETLSRLQDWDLWLTMLRAGRHGVWVGRSLFRTPAMDGITSDSNLPWAAAYRIVRRKHLDFWKWGPRPDLKVSGMMVVFKTKDVADKAYRSVRRFYPDMRLIVVEGSGKGHECRKHFDALSQSDPNLLVLRYDYNVGHGRGMHIGMMTAQSEYVFVFDSDMEMVRHGAIEEMVAKASKSTWGIGKVVDVDDAGFNVDSSPDSIRYVHPYAMLVSRRRYMFCMPFINHGAPSLRAMINIKERGLSKKILTNFPIDNYVKHEGKVTRSKFGIGGSVGPPPKGPYTR